MTTKLFYHGPGDDGDFCDHDDLDPSVECNDERLWAIEEDGAVVGYVCDNHKAAYKKEVDL